MSTPHQNFEEPLAPGDTLENVLAPGEARIQRRKEKRQARRTAKLKFLLRVAVIALAPAIFPSLPLARLPEPAPAPKDPRGSERIVYDNEPAEPAEGVSTLRIRPNL